MVRELPPPPVTAPSAGDVALGGCAVCCDLRARPLLPYGHVGVWGQQWGRRGGV